MAKRKRTSPAEVAPSKASRTTTRKTLRTSKPAAPARITRGMTTDAARKAVFNTSELLENILVHLPARKLFTIQRVNQQFKEAIEGSVEIQQKMFLRLGGEPKEEWLVRSLWGGGRQFYPASYQGRFAEALTSFTVVKANEAVFRPLVYGTGSLDSRGSYLGFRPAMYGSLISTIKGEQHSWDRGYLFDPPGTKLRLELSMTSDGVNICTVSITVNSTSELTMGSLLRESRAERASGTFSAKGVWKSWDGSDQTVQECVLQAEQEAGAELMIWGACVVLSDTIIATEDLRREVEMKASLVPSG
ncbi:hypothetical protein PRZ48_014989 [Zasmidium cellare]|uniref:F-box domain-containing protein n=1 Tax=Zasmidium cellare TaxID=395010 RepID=A0ABR0DXC1_ZASCE|nr:hypothetical protein PRZ48_014989 [Zasmidium cellare]